MRRSEPTERLCVVIRAVLPADQLIRFVLDPEGRVTPDFRHRLPGRGVWVTATRAAIATAEKKKLFTRAFKAPVKVEPGLADRVAALMSDAALSALSLARKAGALTLGFAKVEAAVADGSAVALVHAADAADDGIRKLEAAVRRRGPEATGERATLPSLRFFTSDQLSLALGRPNVIHAALLAGGASTYGLDRIAALARFLIGDADPGGDFHVSPHESLLGADNPQDMRLDDRIRI